MRMNQDHRESVETIPADYFLDLKLYRAGTGVFADRDIRLKQKYVVND
jgi:hypothetical protein